MSGPARGTDGKAGRVRGSAKGPGVGEGVWACRTLDRDSWPVEPGAPLVASVGGGQRPTGRQGLRSQAKSCPHHSGHFTLAFTVHFPALTVQGPGTHTASYHNHFPDQPPGAFWPPMRSDALWWAAASQDKGSSLLFPLMAGGSFTLVCKSPSEAPGALPLAFCSDLLHFALLLASRRAPGTQ